MLGRNAIPCIKPWAPGSANYKYTVSSLGSQNLGFFWHLKQEIIILRNVHRRWWCWPCQELCLTHRPDKNSRISFRFTHKNLRKRHTNDLSGNPSWPFWFPCLLSKWKWRDCMKAVLKWKQSGDKFTEVSREWWWLSAILILHEYRLLCLGTYTQLPPWSLQICCQYI